MEWAGSLVPQGLLVKGAKTAWRQAWLTLMKELAPQTPDGAYARPSYKFAFAPTAQLQARRACAVPHAWVLQTMQPPLFWIHRQASWATLPRQEAQAISHCHSAG